MFQNPKHSTPYKFEPTIYNIHKTYVYTHIICGINSTVFLFMCSLKKRNHINIVTGDFRFKRKSRLQNLIRGSQESSFAWCVKLWINIRPLSLWTRKAWLNLFSFIIILNKYHFCMKCFNIYYMNERKNGWHISNSKCASAIFIILKAEWNFP